MIRKVVCHKALKICELWSDIFTNNSLYHPFWEIVRVSAISFFVIYLGRVLLPSVIWEITISMSKKKENDFSLSGEGKTAYSLKNKGASVKYPQPT